MSEPNFVQKLAQIQANRNKMLEALNRSVENGDISEEDADIVRLQILRGTYRPVDVTIKK